MKAIEITGSIQIEDIKIREIQKPTPAGKEILVRIFAAGINPVDWMAPVYNMFDILGMPTPYIMGSDISGTVVQIGSDISKFKVGDEVIGSFSLQNQGAFAEYAAIDENLVVLKPSNLTAFEAAGVPLASQTALEALTDKLNIQSGQKVLIQAAAGGVGIFAVQLAKIKGAYVVAVGSEKNSEFLKSLGADEVFDYENDFSTLPNDFDAILDSVASSEETLRLLKKGGKYVSLTLPASQELAVSLDVSATNFLYTSNSDSLQKIVDLIEAGELKVFIDKIFSFKDLVPALLYQQAGHSKGKNILII